MKLGFGRIYDSVIRTIRSNQRLHAAAQHAIGLIPDFTVVRNVQRVGPLAFRLRRQRWLLGNDPFASHAYELQLMQELIQPGDVVYDIGANIGYYTRLLAANSGARFIYAFEPMTENLALLRRNVQLGGLEAKVEVMPLALSDRDTQEKLQIDDMTGGTAVLESVSHGAAANARKAYGLGELTEVVTVRRLDTLFRERTLQPPAVIKIDVEGAEASLLRGAAGTLAAFKPRLNIALHGENVARETLGLLHELDYQPFGFTAAAGMKNKVPLSAADGGGLANNNVIALPKTGVNAPTHPSPEQE